MRWVEMAARVAGFVLLAPVGVMYIASGLVVPAPMIPVMWIVWLAFVGLAIWQRQRPWVVLATPFAAAAAWFAILSVGEAAFGWTA